MRVAGAIAVGLLLAGCGGSTVSPSDRLSDAAVLSHDATVFNGGVDSSAGPAGDDGGNGTPAQGPNPPPTACSSSADCPLPPPGCASAYVAVNYFGRQCTAGMCVWQKTDLDCSEADASCAGAARYDAGVDTAEVDGSVWVNLSGCMLVAPAQPAPPQTACDGDASPDAGACPLPASSCSSETWLTYYDDGECVAGACTWQQRVRYCRGGCRAGGCVPPPEPTAPATVVVTTPQ